MVEDADIERIAVEFVIRHEESRGWQVESVESENRGFDLISRRPHPEDPRTAIEVRFIEVKGRAAVGQISLTSNEYKTAQRLKEDYCCTPCSTVGARQSCIWFEILPGWDGKSWSRLSITRLNRGRSWQRMVDSCQELWDDSRNCERISRTEPLDPEKADQSSATPKEPLCYVESTSRITSHSSI